MQDDSFVTRVCSWSHKLRRVKLRRFNWMAAHDTTLLSPTYGSFAADTILVEEETLTGIMSEPVKTFGKWRHTIGLLVLAFVVLLWTGTNFLASVGDLVLQLEQMNVC